MGWTKDEAARARGLMEAFCDADEVAATMGCEPGDLDGLCRDAFGHDASWCLSSFAAVGRARIRVTLMDEATSGNFKALDLVARDQLGMGPVESRRKAAQPKGDGRAADDGRASLRPVQFARTLRVVGE